MKPICYLLVFQLYFLNMGVAQWRLLGPDHNGVKQRAANIRSIGQRIFFNDASNRIWEIQSDTPVMILDRIPGCPVTKSCVITDSGIFISTNCGLYSSSDNGQTWVIRDTLAPYFISAGSGARLFGFTHDAVTGSEPYDYFFSDQGWQSWPQFYTGGR